MWVDQIGYPVFKWLRLLQILGDTIPHWSNQCLHHQYVYFVPIVVFVMLKIHSDQHLCCITYWIKNMWLISFKLHSDDLISTLPCVCLATITLLLFFFGDEENPSSDFASLPNLFTRNFLYLRNVLYFQVDRGVKSPADISMDITKLVQTLGVTPTSFTDGVRLTLSTEVKSWCPEDTVNCFLVVVLRNKNHFLFYWIGKKYR